MKIIKKRPLNFLFQIIIYILLTYLSLPILNHSFRVYFQCRGQCSALRIVSTPWLYHGRKVVVVGFLRIQFEGNVLYPFEVSAKYPLTEGIWVDVTNEMKLKRDELNLKYVRITGSFNSMNHGHGNLSVGAIENIEKVELVYPRREHP